MIFNRYYGQKESDYKTIGLSVFKHSRRKQNLLAAAVCRRRFGLSVIISLIKADKISKLVINFKAALNFKRLKASLVKA